MKNQTIAVWFSCGVASAVAAKVTLDKYGRDNNVIILNNPVLEEHPDNRRFLKQVGEWLGTEIVSVVNPKYPDASCVQVWEDRKFMSGIQGAPCTLELKKNARAHWEATNHTDWHVLGFTADEAKRAQRFAMTERSNLLPVLVDAGLTKADCFRIMQRSGIAPPLPYKEGFPNANCIGCVKATSPTYWNLVRTTHPDVFEARAEQSRALGVRLVRVKGERLFLDELDPNAKGNKLKSMHVECGIFCEEGREQDED